MTLLVLVDGPNLYNDVGRLLSPFMEKRSLGADRSAQYYGAWFDVDRLVAATLHPAHEPNSWQDMGTVIFHSRKGVGAPKSPYSIQGDAVLDFWARQGSNPGTSTVLVDIPGSRQGSEKGIDTSIVVYLFETAERWDRAILFTNDSDFVPAVWALRRRGKRVYCASHSEDLSSPLVQACQHFLPLSPEFLLSDLALFEVLLPNSVLDQFLDSAGIAQHVREIILDDKQVIIAGHPQFPTNADALLQPRLPPGLIATQSGQFASIRAAKLTPSGWSESPYCKFVYSALLRHRDVFSAAKWYSRVQMVK